MYNDLRVRHGLVPSIPLRPPHFQRFSLAKDPAGFWVAQGEDGALAGFGFSWMRREFWFLAQLFVRPDVQAAGIGRALLGHCLQQAERAGAENRALITLAYNRASVGLYIRNGVYPREPLYRMSVPADLLKQRGIAGEHEVLPITPWPAPSEWLGMIDHAALGFRRESQHAFQIGSAARAICIEHHERPAG
jgi:GNAT superfamily N-acetyltransferase